MARKSPKLGRPAAGEIEQRKRRIVDEATRLFISNGFEKTTVEAVGSAAGVTKRTIYEHIGDKDTLFRAVCMEQLPQSLKMRFNFQFEGKSTRDALKDMARLLLDFSLSPDTIALTRMLMAELNRFPDLLHESAMSMRQLYSGLIQQGLNDMTEAGLLPPTDNDRYPHYFYDMIIGGNQTQILFGVKSREDVEDELDERLDIFLYGLLDTHKGGKTA